MKSESQPRPLRLMIVAGEASGDAHAAALVSALRAAAPEIQFEVFGSTGAQMRAAGVDSVVRRDDLAILGLWEIARALPRFWRAFGALKRAAVARKPDAVILVDWPDFNLRLADWLHRRAFRVVYYISPQLWAWRPYRARSVRRDVDLLLSILPFEKDWYAARAPRLKVEFVGNPIAERYARRTSRSTTIGTKSLLLLPGSRASEIARHLPVMIESLGRIRSAVSDLSVGLVLPNEALASQARSLGLPSFVNIRVGGLEQELVNADVAIASTGTVTLECAWFGVPTVAIYKTSFTTYQIARRIVTVKYLAMPNLLANEEVFPEYIQEAATAPNIAEAALKLLKDEALRDRVRQKLAIISGSLGGPGASQRAAQRIYRLLGEPDRDHESHKIPL